MEDFEDRLWLGLSPRPLEGFRFLCYRLTTREELRAMRHTSMNYDLMQSNARLEILTCDADVLALQNVDNTEFWREVLAAHDYDVVVGLRTDLRFTGHEANIIGEHPQRNWHP